MYNDSCCFFHSCFGCESVYTCPTEQYCETSLPRAEDPLKLAGIDTLDAIPWSATRVNKCYRPLLFFKKLPAHRSSQRDAVAFISQGGNAQYIYLFEHAIRTLHSKPTRRNYIHLSHNCTHFRGESRYNTANVMVLQASCGWIDRLIECTICVYLGNAGRKQ